MRAVALMSAVAITASLAVAVPGSVTEDSSWASTPQTCLDMHGEGTEKTLDPPTLNVSEEVYEIGTPSQLVYLSENFDTPVDGDSVEQWREQDFAQTADIDLDGCILTPIGTTIFNGNVTTYLGFEGTFDGSGFTISGFYTDHTTSTSTDSARILGLFGMIGKPQTSVGTVKNVTLVEAAVSSDFFALAGLLAGQNFGTVRESSATGSVTVTESTVSIVGGLVGASQGFVRRSYSHATVNSAGHAGGLVGLMSRGAITDSYALGTVSGTNFVGGLSGNLGDDSSISNSFSAVEVTGQSVNTGGLVGRVGSRNSLTDSFWDTTRNPGLGSPAGTGKTTSELQALSTFANTDTEGLDTPWPIVDRWQPFDLDRNRVWGIRSDLNDGYPFLLWEYRLDRPVCPEPNAEGVYEIRDALDLAAVGSGGTTGLCGLGDNYLQIGDIDLASSGVWSPIGNDSEPFVGSFDGGEWKIRNLTLDASANHLEDQGLFGVLGADANITKVTLETVTLNTSGTRENVGSLAGRSEGATITDSSASDVSFEIAEEPANQFNTFNVGGLLGRVNGGVVTDSSATGAITSLSGRRVGGLIGRASGSDSVSIVRSTTNVTISNFRESGGLIGYADPATITVDTASVTGQVTTTGSDTGGAFGYFEGRPGTITNVSVNAHVRGTNQIGGMAGQLQRTVTVEDSMVTGTVVATGNQIGGAVGEVRGFLSNVSITDVTANVTVTADGNHVGGLVGQTNGTTIISTSSASGSVKGDEATGGLVGQTNGTAIISTSSASGNVTGDRARTGGLIGATSNTTTVSSSRASGNVTGGTSRTGGLVGQTVGTTTITQSAATGTVTGGVDADTNDNVSGTGGLVGLGSGVTTVTASFAAGNVTGPLHVGGLIGLSDRVTVEDSYSTGAVAGTDSAGGLIGDSFESTISRSYSTGLVSGSTGAGGLIGTASSAGTITASFWDTDTSGQQTSAADVGKTTAEMVALSTFVDAGWSIASCTTTGQSTLWGIQDGDYPFLTWQDTPQLSACPTPGVSSPGTSATTRPRPQPEADLVDSDTPLTLVSPANPGLTPDATGEDDTVIGQTEEASDGLAPQTGELSGPDGELTTSVPSEADASGSSQGSSNIGWLWAIGVGGVAAALLIGGGLALARRRL